jgi:aspartate racemase
MKHIGIVGGLGPKSTAEYYKIICHEFNEKFSELNYPEMTIRSVNLQRIATLFKADKWEEMAEEIVKALHDLKNAGADFAAIATNTPHNGFDFIKAKSPLPLLSIMDATAQKIKENNMNKVLLLGTKQTMEHGFFQKTFSSYGIETIIPKKEDRDLIDDLIWTELIHGIITEETKAKFLEIIAKTNDIQGIIFGCTEIPLLLKQEDCTLPVYDTTTIHAKAILAYSLKEN